MGLTPHETAGIQHELERGNREAATVRIAAAQERQRAEFRAATGIDVAAITPVVGRDISWSDIVRHVFRVCDFDRAGTTIGPNDEVQGASEFSPYGYLLVESPILNQHVRLPIIHRDDFLLAASVFDEPRLANVVAQGDLLVTYAPQRMREGGLSDSPLHMLHYVITPRGTLDLYYAADNDVHMRAPRPEKLFGPFVYEGEIRVQTNAQPTTTSESVE